MWQSADPALDKFLPSTKSIGLKNGFYPFSTDTGLGNNRLLLIPHRTDVVEGFVQPFPVVEHLDPLEDRTSGFGSRPEVLIPGEFVLQRKSGGRYCGQNPKLQR